MTVGIRTSAGREPAALPAGEILEALGVSAEEGLGEAEAERVRAAGGTVAQAHLRMGRADREVVGLAEEVGVGIVVTGSRGHGGIRRALMSSISDSVVRHAHCAFIQISHGSLRKVEPQPSRISTTPWSRTRKG